MKSFKDKMTSQLSRPLIVLLLCGIGGSAAPVQAEIERRSPAGLSPLPHGERLSTECWQHGVKIFEDSGYSGLDLETIAKSNSLRLKQDHGDQKSLVVVPLNETVCFVRGRPENSN